MKHIFPALALAVALPSVAVAQVYGGGTDCSASVGTSASTVLPATTPRSIINLQNTSTATICYSWTGTASCGAAGSYTLAPGAFVAYPSMSGGWVPTGALSAIASAAGSELACTTN